MSDIKSDKLHQLNYKISHLLLTRSLTSQLNGSNTLPSAAHLSLSQTMFVLHHLASGGCNPVKSFPPSFVAIKSHKINLYDVSPRDRGLVVTCLRE
jgi:hypothetical protein